ncbi:unnamed protein product [Calypogeia fissa]
MSVLRKAGYVAIYQTSTTILFEKIRNDAQNNVNPRDFQRVGEIEGEAILEIERMDLNIDSIANNADASYSNNQPESNLQRKLMPSFPFDWPAEQQPTTLKSFIAALKSGIHDSFCVSNEWLSRLEDCEMHVLYTNVLGAGYAETNQSGNTTIFEKIRDHVGHPTGGLCDDPCNTSNRKEVAAGETRKRGAFESSDILLNKKSKGKMSTENKHTSSSVEVSAETRQDDQTTCRPQYLKVACRPIPTSSTASASSSSHSGSHTEYSRRVQFGDSVVILPAKVESRVVSTKMERKCNSTRVDFVGDKGGGVVPVSLKAAVTTVVSCCLINHGNSAKVRIKFWKISGQVLNQESNEHQCNGLALSCLRTNVYACLKSKRIEDGQEELKEEIRLHLDDEYYCHPRRRVVDNSLVWLHQLYGPDNCEAVSTTLWLEGDIIKRCISDLARKVKKAHSLHFDDHRPVIFHGNVSEGCPNLFLEVNIRYELEFSYLKPEPASVTREAIAAPCRRVSEIQQFDCDLVITTQNFEFAPP